EKGVLNHHPATEHTVFRKLYRLDERNGPAKSGDNSRNRRNNGYFNPWAVAGSVMKYFRFTEEKVLWGMSWANLALYAESIPKYEKHEKVEETNQVTGADLFKKYKK